MSLQIILVALNACLLKAIEFFFLLCWCIELLSAVLQHSTNTISAMLIFFFPETLCLSVTLQNLLGITDIKVV